MRGKWCLEESEFLYVGLGSGEGGVVSLFGARWGMKVSRVEDWWEKAVKFVNIVLEDMSI